MQCPTGRGATRGHCQEGVAAPFTRPLKKIVDVGRRGDQFPSRDCGAPRGASPGGTPLHCTLVYARLLLI